MKGRDTGKLGAAESAQLASITYCGNRENLKLARPKLRCDTDVARPVKILVQALGGRNHLYNIRQLTSVLRDDTNVEHRQDALSAEDYQKLK
ncbi:hypothetical protein X801_04319, partial [Opisthorchis viverrini]